MTNNKCIESLREVIGLIPAGGQGARIGRLPSTKLFHLFRKPLLHLVFLIPFEPHDTFVQLLDRLKLSHCDVVLGLFPSGRPHKIDMVDIDPEGKVRNIVIKPQQTDLNYTWGVAVWTPAFTRFMHGYVKAYEPFAAQQKELFIGEVVMAAITEGLGVEAVHVSDEAFLDIGTPEDLLRTAKLLLARVE